MVIIAKHENKDNLIYKQSLAGSLSSLFSKAPLENSVVCFWVFFFYCLLGFGGGFLLFVLGFFSSSNHHLLRHQRQTRTQHRQN